MTTRTQAERVLFDVFSTEHDTRRDVTNICNETVNMQTHIETVKTSADVDKPDVSQMGNVSLPEAEKLTANLRQDKTTRRRVNATYCPICSGWVEVRLQPVRLRCVRCGLEAKP